MSCEASALPAAAVLCRRAASVSIFLAVPSNSGHFCQISGFAFDLSVSEPSGKREGILAAFFEMISAFAATTGQFPVFAFSWMLFQASPFFFINCCRSSTISAGDFGCAVVNTATSKVVTATRAPRLIDGRIVSFLSRGAARSDPAGGTALAARSYSRAYPAAGPGAHEHGDAGGGDASCAIGAIGVRV